LAFIISFANYIDPAAWPTTRRLRIACMLLFRLPDYWFLPRCMKCRRGLAMRILSVRLSVTRVYC